MNTFQQSNQGISVDEPPKRDWLGRNWKWFLPVGCFSAVIITVGCAAILVGIILTVLKSTDVYKDTLAAAQGHPAVIEALGKPVTAGFFFTGNVNVSGGSGSADLSIPVHGPKGKGTVFSVATKRAGRWHFQTLDFQTDDGSDAVNLLPVNASTYRR